MAANVQFLYPSASVNRTDLLIEKLEKLAALPPVCIDKAFKYTVNGCGIDCEVTTSLAFEAATKFAIWAKEVCGLQDSILKQTN